MVLVARGQLGAPCYAPMRFVFTNEVRIVTGKRHGRAFRRTIRDMPADWTEQERLNPDVHQTRQSYAIVQGEARPEAKICCLA